MLVRGKNKRKSLRETESSGSPLKQLEIGQRVLIQNPQTKSWDQECQITGIRPTGRSYDVLFDNGKSSIRNRTFLRPINWKASDNKELNLPSTDDNQPPDANPALTLRRSTRLANRQSQSK